MSRCATPDARRAFRSLSVRGQEQPTSPIMPARMPVPSTPSVMSSTISDRAGDDVFFAPIVHIGRVVGTRVVGGAHDDVQAGLPRDAREGDRVAGDADAGGVDNGVAPVLFIERRLLDGGVHVQYPRVVGVGGGVVPDISQRLQGHGRVVDCPGAGFGWGLPTVREVDQQVLVRKSDAQLRRTNWAGDRLDMAGLSALAHPKCLPEELDGPEHGPKS